MHKIEAYPPLKSLFFLRPFYVFSTSFLRNWYYEVWGLHSLHNSVHKKTRAEVKFLSRVCKINNTFFLYRTINLAFAV